MRAPRARPDAGIVRNGATPHARRIVLTPRGNRLQAVFGLDWRGASPAQVATIGPNDRRTGVREGRLVAKVGTALAPSSRASAEDANQEVFDGTTGGQTASAWSHRRTALERHSTSKP